MQTDVVFTLTGPDRVGVVEEVTRALLSLGGNIGAGRMARLGGEFAMLMLVSLPSERVAEIDAACASLIKSGYKLAVNPAAPTAITPMGDAATYQIDVRGADHEGIIHEVAHQLARRDINIESAETGTVEAPVTGVPLFFMKALVRVPNGLDETEWMEALDEAAHAAGVDIDIMPETEAS